MNSTLERLPMAKKTGRTGRPKHSERNDVAVKLDRAMVGMAKLVATRQGVSVAELLSDLLRAPLDRAYSQMLKELEGKG